MNILNEDLEIDFVDAGTLLLGLIAYYVNYCDFLLI
jgi:hypothetical protein